jgi:hypothetical protein
LFLRSDFRVAFCVVVAFAVAEDQFSKQLFLKPVSAEHRLALATLVQIYCRSAIISSIGWGFGLCRLRIDRHSDPI